MTPGRRRAVTLTVMLGTLSVVAEATIINVAIPELTAVFALAQTEAQWLATGFFAAMTVTMLISGWCAERFGLRATYAASLGAFVLASAAGALAPVYELVVAARVLQGAAAGIVQPLALVVLFKVYPPERRGAAMGLYGLGVILGPALAPSLGGLLVDSFSWRAVFLVAAPLGLATLALTLAVLRLDTRAERRRPFDLPGLLLLALGLTACLWGLANGRLLGWADPLVLAALLGGPLAGAGFVWRQLAQPDPMVDLRVQRVPGFAAASLLAFVVGVGLYGTTYLLPLFVQQVQGLSATASGLLLMPAGLAMAAIFPLSGHLSDRVRSERQILAGVALLALSTAALAGMEATSSFTQLAAWTLVGRLGLGLMMPPVNAGGLRLLPPELVAQGSGAISFARQIGGAFGVNLLAVILELRAADHRAAQAAAEGLPPGAGLLPAAETLALELAFRDAFLALTALTLLAVLPAWRMGRAAARRGAGGGTEGGRSGADAAMRK